MSMSLPDPVTGHPSDSDLQKIVARERRIQELRQTDPAVKHAWERYQIILKLKLED